MLPGMRGTLRGSCEDACPDGHPHRALMFTLRGSPDNSYHTTLQPWMICPTSWKRPQDLSEGCFPQPSFLPPSSGVPDQAKLRQADSVLGFYCFSVLTMYLRASSIISWHKSSKPLRSEFACMPDNLMAACFTQEHMLVITVHYLRLCIGQHLGHWVGFGDVEATLHCWPRLNALEPVVQMGQVLNLYACSTMQTVSRPVCPSADRRCRVGRSACKEHPPDQACSYTQLKHAMSAMEYISAASHLWSARWLFITCSSARLLQEGCKRGSIMP